MAITNGFIQDRNELSSYQRKELKDKDWVVAQSCLVVGCEFSCVGVFPCKEDAADVASLMEMRHHLLNEEFRALAGYNMSDWAFNVRDFMESHGALCTFWI